MGIPAPRTPVACRMRLIRAFEESLAGSFARGDLPTETVHLSIGQEATAVGVCFALRADDYMTTTHRGHGHMLAKCSRSCIVQEPLYHPQLTQTVS